MVIAPYFAIILATVTQSALAKLFNRRSGDAAVFNLTKALAALALFLLMAPGGFTLHPPTLLWGLAYGACQCTSMYMGYRALCLGPMALTSMLVSFSVVIPLLWGLTVGKEHLTPFHLLGLILLLGAMVLTNADKLWQRKGAEERGGEPREPRYALWLFFVGATFLCNGAASILQKQHQTYYPEAYTREFMLFAMAVCALVFSVLSLHDHPIRRIKKATKKHLGALAGVAMGLTNFLTLTLSGLENASVLFPMISAGTLLGSLLCGRLLFGERLKGNHYIALFLGIAAVILLKL